MVGVTTPEPAEAPGGADRADPTFEMLPGDIRPPNGFIYWCSRGHWTRSAHGNLEDEGCWAPVSGSRCTGTYGEALVPWVDVLTMLDGVA